MTAGMTPLLLPLLYAYYNDHMMSHDLDSHPCTFAAAQQQVAPSMGAEKLLVLLPTAV